MCVYVRVYEEEMMMITSKEAKKSGVHVAGKKGE